VFARARLFVSRFAVSILIAVVSSIHECFGFCAGGSGKKKKKKVVACMSKASSENSLAEICCVERDTETQTKERRRRSNQGAKPCRYKERRTKSGNRIAEAEEALE